MATPDSATSVHRLRRTILLCAICVSASALGMLLASPIAARFRGASAWVLPGIASAVLLLLVLGAFVVLPRKPG